MSLEINKLSCGVISCFYFTILANKSRFKYLVLFFSLLTSCVTHKESVIGEYKSAKCDKIYSIFLRINHTAVIKGSSLCLAIDSTFKETNCGNIITGIFKVKNDSLYLFCQQNQYKNDSINQIKKLDCYEKPMVFSISRNKLKAMIKLKGHRRKVLLYLEKVKIKIN